MGRRKGEIAKMGKSLIKDRFRGKPKRGESGGFLHTTELNDDTDYRGNILSITDQNSMDDFLATAELAGRDFTAQRTNVQIVSASSNTGILSPEQRQKVHAAQEQHKDLLRIPRRPAWTEATSADQLQHNENMAFLDWRRQLSQLQEKDHICITPYEKNLEFWRQLWRVLERSDVVVQIVDARNPLLFFCPDLELYVREIDPKKQALLLVNKADLLTEQQRQAWADYFTSKGIKAIFWSAVEEIAKMESEKEGEEKNDEASSEAKNDDDDEEEEDDDDDDDDVEDVEYSDDDNEADVNDDENVTAGADSNINPTSENKDGQRKSQRANDTEEKDAALANKDGSSKNDTENRNNTNSALVGEVEKTGDVGSNQVCEGAKPVVNNIGDSVCCARSGEDQETNKDILPKTRTEDEIEDESEDYDSDEFETEEEYTADEEAEEDEKEEEERKKKDGEKKKKKKEEHLSVECVQVSSALQSGEELLQLFRQAAKSQYTSGVTTVGMVGYPNVGKSSTINAILRTKKVPVSATPGRTKHFQTLYVEKDLMLCDCPGLVFPSFVNSKADLVVNGILPIDQLQDSESPVTLVCHRIGRQALQATYRLNLPPPEAWEDAEKPPSAYDIMQAYGALRGFMTHKGNVDRPRAARLILKDYVSGRLLFCHPPPGIGEKEFQKPPYVELKVLDMPHFATPQKSEYERKQEALDREFFAQAKSKAHAQGPHAVKDEKQQQQAGEGKPWKKHHNRNKKEKLRRVYADLDRQL